MLHQVAQRAIDLERAVEFYTRLLEAPPLAVFDPPGLAFFSLGPTRLLLDRGAPSALIYLQVPDIHARLKQLSSQGVRVLAAPTVIFADADGQFGPAGEDEWMAFIEDSEGNTVGLASRVPTPTD